MLRQILLLCICSLVFSSLAQEPVNLKIISFYSGTPATYCFTPLQVMPMFEIQGNNLPPALKVSVTNYKKSQDTLYYNGNNPSIKAVWNANGSLIISGAINLTDYQLAIRNVFYKNLSQNPLSEVKNITISLTDADFLPATGHFYKYVSHPGVSWSSARDAAATQKLYGLQGYLATITSKDENDFIWTKTKGVGWIGASDAEEEGKWKWMSGPEKGTLFWNGNGSGNSVNGAYSNWNTGEPNNMGGEHYAHITFNVGIISSWNDLANTGATNPQSNYYPQGYLIEFGGMEANPGLQLSDFTEINVVNFKFANLADHTICQFDSVQLNHKQTGSYVWEPAIGLSDPKTSNPKASPMQNTVYKVTASFGSCIQTKEFKVNVNPAPIIKIDGPRDICEGEIATLKAIPQNTSANYSYLWNTNESSQTIQSGKHGQYLVTAKNEFCSFRDSIQLHVHGFPVYSTQQSDTLVCGPKIGKLKIEGDDLFVMWTALDPKMNIENRTLKSSSMTVPGYGQYDIAFKVNNSFGCTTNDTLQVGFFQQPTSSFDIDTTVCHGYNLKVHYTGNASADAQYRWMYIDTLSDIGLKQVDISLGFDDRPNRFLKLQVEENGCVSSVGEKYIKVKPNIRIWADTTASCQPFAVNFHSKATEPIHYYEWNFGDGFVSNATSPTNTYHDAGIYDVVLKVVSDEGCENKAVMKNMITVHPIPSNDLDLDSLFCYGDTISINYTGDSGNSSVYYWDLSELNPDEILQAPQSDVGKVIVSLKSKPASTLGFQVMSRFNCKSEKITVPFKRKPRAAIEANLLEGCPPLDINFKISAKDTIDQHNYFWNFEANDWTKGGEQMQHIFSKPDDHPKVFVAINSPLTGCSDTTQLEQQIVVYPVPVAAFQPDTPEVSIIDPRFQFRNNSTGAELYSWDFGDEKGFSSDENPFYSYSELGYFDVMLAVENKWACHDTTQQQVLVKFEKIFAPNAFSPNSPNPDDQQFLPYAEGIQTESYHLQLFNRWGQVIYECNNELKGWDGRMANGNPAPAGTYIWVLNYSDFLEKNHRQTGQVTLLY